MGNNGNWRFNLLKEVHDSALGGHSGVTATYRTLKGMFYWPNMKEEVHTYINSYAAC